MGILHPLSSQKVLTSSEEMYNDIATAHSLLDMQGYTIEATLEAVDRMSRSASITTRYVDARQTIQDNVDKVPTHRLGIRQDSMTIKDKSFDKGGVRILRDPP